MAFSHFSLFFAVKKLHFADRPNEKKEEGLAISLKKAGKQGRKIKKRLLLVKKCKNVTSCIT